MSSARNVKLGFASAPEEEKLVSDYSSDKLVGCFYKISNHEELYRIGKEVLKEMQKGVRNFAFTSTGYKNAQQRTILGLCCFFDQHAHKKIAVVSDHFSQGVLGDLVDSSTLNSFPMINGEDIVNFKSFHQKFDFIDYAEIKKLFENDRNANRFEEEMARFFGQYSAVLWDIPEMEQIKQNSQFHYRISRFYESVTVIVSPQSSATNQVDFIKNFFSNYNINLSGVLFDTSGLKEQAKRRRILGIF